jgi:hypothetical protein
MAAAKSGLMAILGGGPEDEADDDMPMSEPGGGMKSAKVSAMRRLMSAIKSGDAEAAAEAFSDAYDACGTSEPDMGALDEEDEV